MAQNRTERLVILLEPIVYQAMQVLINNKENKISESAYGRKLVIDNLLESGLLTEKMLIDATT